MKNVTLILLHNNIVNKHGNVVETSITNIDIHDIARTCKTYGITEYAVVTRLQSQKRLLEEVIDYWVDGKGGKINPDRRLALEIINHYNDINAIIEKYENCSIIITDAKKHDRNISYLDMRNIIKSQKDKHFLLVFGTGWGLDSLITSKSEYVLEPIEGDSSYNHLSVRAACAIICDRLFGNNF
ncbi:MAG: RNA methyltransferase [Candidatus Muirbacterium halophilum]|nr:RNA methyltransferase [Candidatus Muirbacterium halophilum]MCK9475275.1 RNA methyltransferase [Candidatus Muirbacterium halophilum]